MKRRLVSVAIVVTVGLLLTILVLIPRPPSPPIMVHHIKSVRSGNLVTATFEITNHTTSRYSFYPVLVEIRKGPVWKTYSVALWESYSDLNTHPSSFLGPHDSQTFTVGMGTLPTGSPLRLRMNTERQLVGLMGLFVRLELLFRRGLVSVNPFDKTTTVFSKPTQVVSDEFEPQPK